MLEGTGSRQDWIVEAGWALVHGGQGAHLVRDVSIVVRDGLITEIKQGWIRGSNSKIDARKHLVLPGFVSSHTHTGTSASSRGLIEGGRLYDRPMAAVETLDDDDLDVVTAYNLAEILRSGCTTIVEMSSSFRLAHSFVRVAHKWGVRAYVGVMVPTQSRLFDIWYRDDDRTLFDSVPETLREIETEREFCLSLKQHSDDQLILPKMGAHATDTHTPETLAAVRDAGLAIGTGIQIHLAQREREVQAVKRLWGMRPVEWLANLGIFDQQVIAAHLFKIDTVLDLPILQRHGVTFAHCACAALYGHHSTQPLPEALAAGVNTSLGIDSGNNDYIANIQMATLQGQLRATTMSDSTAATMQFPTVADVVHAATVGGANALNRPDLGRIKEGGRADMCTVDVSGFIVGVGSLPPEPLHHLLYASSSAVRNVMTDGRLQLNQGQLTITDERQLTSQAGELSEHIWKHLDKEGWFNAPLIPNAHG